jgi:hypothetical protein
MSEDSVWKEALDACFEPFLRFFFPAIHPAVDWGEKHAFLDKELQRLTPPGARGRRYADKLVQVRLRGEETTLLLVHVEVQGKLRKHFARRLFFLNCRISERYGLPVVTLVVLTGPGGKARISHELDLWGFELRFTAAAVRLHDYRGKEPELELERNPFALIVLAHLRRWKARTHRSRLEAKIGLVRLLHEREYNREEIVHLFRFIDWLIRVPDELEREFAIWFTTYQEERAMPYVTSIERLAREEGRQEGRQEGREEGRWEGLEEGLLEAVQTALELRFGRESLSLLERIRPGTGALELRRLKDAVIAAGTREELEALFR